VSTALLDANVLIALSVADHEHHDRASSWLEGADRFAVCPIVEGALVRFLVRMGETGTTVHALLAAIHAHPACEFWPDRLSYRDLDLGHIHGHRQVTDHYLVALALERSARLATFDVTLARAHPAATIAIP
jgi:toxin-antitoxin system PIN domain toxin